MSVLSRLCVVALTAPMLALSLGCGGEPQGASDLPPLTPVEVTVMYNGAPVQGATVSFSPVTSGTKEKALAASGSTDEDGVATMIVRPGDEGVAAGKYKVTVRKLEKPKETGTKGDINEGGYKPPEATGDMNVEPPKNLLPEKYSATTTTDLEITVAEGDDTIEQTFELKD